MVPKHKFGVERSTNVTVIQDRGEQLRHVPGGGGERGPGPHHLPRQGAAGHLHSQNQGQQIS